MLSEKSSKNILKLPGFLEMRPFLVICIFSSLGPSSAMILSISGNFLLFDLLVTAVAPELLFCYIGGEF